jgi:hypothetical protein
MLHSISSRIPSLMRNLFLSLVFCAAALAQQGAPNTLRVPASTVVNLPPSQVVFQLDVFDTSRSLDAVVGLIKDAGFSASNLVSFTTDTTSSGVFYFIYEFELPVPFSSFSTTRDRLDQLRRTLGNTISLSYSTTPATPSPDDVASAREKALPDLIALARQKAPALASSLKVNLGAIQSVEEVDTATTGLAKTFAVNVTFATTP